MEDLLLLSPVLFGIGLIVVVSVLYARANRFRPPPDPDRADPGGAMLQGLHALARRLGLEVSGSSLRGKIQGLTVEVAIDDRAVGRQIRIWCLPPGDWRFDAGAGDASGDPAFDALIRARGDPARGAILLSATVRDLLIRLFQTGQVGAVELDDYQLRIAVKGLWSDPDPMEGLVPLAVELARAVSRKVPPVQALKERALQDPVPQVRRRALAVLAATHPSTAEAQACAQALRTEPHAPTRLAAARILLAGPEPGPQEGLQILEGLGSDSDVEPAPRLQATALLWRHRPDPEGPLPARVRRDLGACEALPSDLRREVVSALVVPGGTFLREMIYLDASWASALQELEARGDPSCLQVLGALAEDDSLLESTRADARKVGDQVRARAVGLEEGRVSLAAPVAPVGAVSRVKDEA